MTFFWTNIALFSHFRRVARDLGACRTCRRSCATGSVPVALLWDIRESCDGGGGVLESRAGRAGAARMLDFRESCDGGGGVLESRAGRAGADLLLDLSENCDGGRGVCTD